MHFQLINLVRQAFCFWTSILFFFTSILFLEENRSIKPFSGTFLCHFIGNVKCLAWPGPALPTRNYEAVYNLNVETKPGTWG